MADLTRKKLVMLAMAIVIQAQRLQSLEARNAPSLLLQGQKKLLIKRKRAFAEYVRAEKILPDAVRAAMTKAERRVLEETRLFRIYRKSAVYTSIQKLGALLDDMFDRLMKERGKYEELEKVSGNARGELLRKLEQEVFPEKHAFGVVIIEIEDWAREQLRSIYRPHPQ